MLSKQLEDKRMQMEMVWIEKLVPEDHLVRKLDAAIDFDFIYDLVEDLYSKDKGPAECGSRGVGQNGVHSIHLWHSFDAPND